MTFGLGGIAGFFIGLPFICWRRGEDVAGSLDEWDGEENGGGTALEGLCLGEAGVCRGEYND